MDTDALAESDEQQFEWILVPPAPAPDGDDPTWQEKAAELRRRQSELGKRLEDLRERRAEIDSRGTGRDQEMSLDDARRALVGQWETIDELSSILRDESAWLDRRRNELAEQEHKLGTLSEEISSLREQRDRVHEREGHSDEWRELNNRFASLNPERVVAGEQFSARVEEYNRHYDDFLRMLDTKMPLAAQMIADLGRWAEERHAHNEQTNKDNTDRRLLDTNFAQWEYEDRRLSEDIREFLGPFQLTLEAQKALRHQLDQVIWRAHDQNIAGKLFEMLCMDLLSHLGLHVAHSGGNNDGGIDITAEEITRAGAHIQYFAQCKLRSKEGSKGVIGQNEVSKFIGDLPKDPTTRNLFMTLGNFDDAACERAEEHGIDLWNGEKLLERLVKEAVGFQKLFGIDGFQCRINSGYWENIEARI